MKKYHKHDCSACTYLDSETQLMYDGKTKQNVDLYICLGKEDWETSLVVRCGSEGSEYYCIDLVGYRQVYLNNSRPTDKYKTLYNKAIKKGIINKLS